MKARVGFCRNVDPLHGLDGKTFPPFEILQFFSHRFLERKRETIWLLPCLGRNFEGLKICP